MPLKMSQQAFKEEITFYEMMCCVIEKLTTGSKMDI